VKVGGGCCCRSKEGDGGREEFIWPPPASDFAADHLLRTKLRRSASDFATDNNREARVRVTVLWGRGVMAMGKRCGGDDEGEVPLQYPQLRPQPGSGIPVEGSCLASFTKPLLEVRESGSVDSRAKFPTAEERLEV
jgi:hypothetical protein